MKSTLLMLMTSILIHTNAAQADVIPFTGTGNAYGATPEQACGQAIFMARREASWECETKLQGTLVNPTGTTCSTGLMDDVGYYATITLNLLCVIR